MFALLKLPVKHDEAGQREQSSKTWVISCGAGASGLQVVSSESNSLPEGQLGANGLSTLPEGHDFWGLTNLTS